MISLVSIILTKESKQRTACQSITNKRSNKIKNSSQEPTSVVINNKQNQSRTRNR